MNYLNPIRWLQFGGQFLHGWFLSLPLRQAPKIGLALVSIALFAITAIAGASNTSTWRDKVLDGQIGAAFQREDFDTVELVLNRKLTANPADPTLRYQLGITHQWQDRDDAAVDVMRSLFNSENHVPSAKWLLSNQYIGKPWTSLTDQDRQEFGRILRLINREEPNDYQAKQLLADYYIASEQLDRAVPLLDDLSVKEPMRGLQAAAVARRLGDTVSAERLARRTLETVDQRLDEDPKNLVLALAVAQNQVFLQRHQEAVNTLEKALRQADDEKNRQVLRKSLSDVLIGWVREIQQRSEISYEDQIRVMRLLEAAVRVSPNNPRVLQMVADQVLSTMNEKDEQIAMLRRSLVKGSSPGIAHFIRGTGALLLEDTESATRSLRMAAELLPNTPAILNNLAVALSQRGEEYYDEALTMSNQAIVQATTPTPHYFETRGQILVRLDRHEEAIVDLERALSEPSLAGPAHRALAVCYEKIGETEIAQMHEDAAKQAANEAPADANVFKRAKAESDAVIERESDAE